jgi:hypothetical protein
MSKRFYISPVIGTGAWDDPFRAAVADEVQKQANGGVVAVIPTNPTTGRPLFTFALCIVAVSNHAALDAVVNADRFPDITLDSKISVLTTAQRNALLNFASRRGISTTGLTINSTFRDVVERIGKHLNIHFNALNFDVAE